MNLPNSCFYQFLKPFVNVYHLSICALICATSSKWENKFQVTSPLKSSLLDTFEYLYLGSVNEFQDLCTYLLALKWVNSILPLKVFLMIHFFRCCSEDFTGPFTVQQRKEITEYRENCWNPYSGAWNTFPQHDLGHSWTYTHLLHNMGL